MCPLYCRIKSRLQEVFATWGKGAPCGRPASFAAAALGLRQGPPGTAGSPTPSPLSPRRAGTGPATAATASSAARHGRCSRTDKARDGENEGAGARCRGRKPTRAGGWGEPLAGPIRPIVLNGPPGPEGRGEAHFIADPGHAPVACPHRRGAGGSPPRGRREMESGGD